MHHFERWQITLKLCQQEQEHGDDENYFPNECWALMLSCGFSSELGLPLRGKRPGEGGGREGGGEDGGREEDEENEENNFEVMEEEKRMNYIEDDDE